MKIGPKFRSPHPVLTLVLRNFICSLPIAMPAQHCLIRERYCIVMSCHVKSPMPLCSYQQRADCCSRPAHKLLRQCYSSAAWVTKDLSNALHRVESSSMRDFSTVSQMLPSFAFRLALLWRSCFKIAAPDQQPHPMANPLRCCVVAYFLLPQACVSGANQSSSLPCLPAHSLLTPC